MSSISWSQPTRHYTAAPSTHQNLPPGCSASTPQFSASRKAEHDSNRLPPFGNRILNRRSGWFFGSACYGPMGPWPKGPWTQDINISAAWGGGSGVFGIIFGFVGPGPLKNASEKNALRSFCPDFRAEISHGEPDRARNNFH